jgi:hypothetical protein
MQPLPLRLVLSTHFRLLCGFRPSILLLTCKLACHTLLL